MLHRSWPWFALAAASLITGFAWRSPQPQDGPAPDFTLRVLPILTRAGCNSGQCHGAAGGQAGFALSLRGYDPDADFDAIVHEFGGRRVDIANPERSLLLKKPSLQMGHRGGRKLPADSAHFSEVKRWIAGGAPRRAEGAVAPVAISVDPATISGRPGETSRLRTRVVLADGRLEDSTDVVLFYSGNEAVARVDATGQVTLAGPGETAILVKFLGMVAAARVAVPYGDPVAPHDSNDPVDALIYKKLGAMGLSPAPACDDVTFLRRASLDLAGRIPSPGEVRECVAAGGHYDRAALVARLLDSKDGVSRWTRWFGDLCRIRVESMGPDGARRLNEYIYSQLERDRPLDELVVRMVVSSGAPWEPGPAAFSLATEGPAAQMEFVTRTFWGARLACAQCHQHPFDRWSREDYFGLAAFFARVRRENGKIILSPYGEFNDPKSGLAARPRFPAVPGAAGAVLPPIVEGQDRRALFAEWLVSKDADRFDRAMVNRLWRELMGSGLIEPVDDVRESNPASNEPLMNELIQQFRAGGRRLRPFLARVASTAAYGRANDGGGGGDRGGRYYARAALRPLSGAVLLDAIAAATGAKVDFPAFAAVHRAQDAYDDDGGSYTLKSLGRCPRDGSADPAYTESPGIPSALHWIHGPVAAEWLALPGGTVDRIVAKNTDARACVEELYISALSRPPRQEELATGLAVVGSPPSRQAAEDLFWALLATAEFSTNH
jgi:hypothetical protein